MPRLLIFYLSSLGQLGPVDRVQSKVRGRPPHILFRFPTMPKKALKFRDHLVKKILSGDKYVTWRLYDDKNLQAGDIVDMINWNTGEKFGEAKLIQVKEKKMGELTKDDLEGHENFESEEQMYQIYRTYY